MFFIFLLLFVLVFNSCSEKKFIASNSERKYQKIRHYVKTTGKLNELLFSVNGNLISKNLNTKRDKSYGESVDFAFYYARTLFLIKGQSLINTTTGLSCEFPSRAKKFVDSYYGWGVWIGTDNKAYAVSLDKNTCEVELLAEDAYSDGVYAEDAIKTDYGIWLLLAEPFNGRYRIKKELALARLDARIELIEEKNLYLYKEIEHNELVDGKYYSIHRGSDISKIFLCYDIENDTVLYNDNVDLDIKDFILDRVHNVAYEQYYDRIMRRDLSTSETTTIYSGNTEGLLLDNHFNLIFTESNKLCFLNTLDQNLSCYEYATNNIKLFSIVNSEIYPSIFAKNVKKSKDFSLSFYSLPMIGYGPAILLIHNGEESTEYTYNKQINLADFSALGYLNLRAGFVYKDTFYQGFHEYIKLRDNFDGGVENSQSVYAISKDSPKIKAWASECVSYSPGTNVDSVWQDAQNALGKAEGTSYGVVSLGRGGSITLGFEHSIRNDDGFDFVVFENAFNDGFLELAFVEVSTDGTIYTRFTNLSYVEGPVGAYESIDTRDIYNLASKYKQGYGHPFDLDELKYNIEVLSGDVDLNNINYIRIVDIIGDGTTLDSTRNPIYDPYPTVGSAGFDLDAIGVINEN